MKAGFFKQLCEIAGKENVRTDEPMKQHTTFRIGGAADYFVSPQTTDQIKNIIELCKSEAMPWYVIGNGSNLLVSDRGFRGVIIQLFKNFSDLRIHEPAAARDGARRGRNPPPRPHGPHAHSA